MLNRSAELECWTEVSNCTPVHDSVGPHGRVELVYGLELLSKQYFLITLGAVRLVG